MIFAFVYSCFIIIYPNKFTANLLQMYQFDNPEESYYDERRPKLPTQAEAAEEEYEEEEEEVLTREKYYSFKNDKIKYYIQGLALLNFIVSYIFEKVIVPSTTAIWNARKIRKLREKRKIESEQALTMQQLFQLSEN